MGSNLGDRERNLRRAMEALGRLQRTVLVSGSSLHETVPVGGVPQGMYLNAAAILETGLGPRELLDQLLRIETESGRKRPSQTRWGPRTLDLDLILYGDRVIDEDGLKVPHPRMHERLFVLAPLVEIAPDSMHPALNKSVRQLYEALLISSEL